MTTEEAIEYWERFNAEIDDLYDICSDAERDTLVKQREAVEFTISFLRAQQQFNDPLTGWISVKERVPENENAVLCTTKNGRPFVGRYDHHWKHWRVSGSVKVTHWMPLPEPPEEGTI